MLQSLTGFHSLLRVPDQTFGNKVQEYGIIAFQRLPKCLGAWLSLLALGVDNDLWVSDRIYGNRKKEKKRTIS